ncbi:MAG TPA: KH domain-containing protein [Candidatus Nanoarchaeia archaeon]|nr:KH domain-containing protein [Candidatus Nanoarchaeia archaeon]
MEFNYETRIPKERVAVLLGIKGEMKKRIEKILCIKVKVDSEDGTVVLSGNDSLNLIIGQNVVKAVGRGFNPEIALELTNEDSQLEIIDMTEFTGESKKKFIRIKARAIGEGGKARKYIEQLTETSIVIYGKTVAIIGNYENVNLARRAFEGLLSGQRHSTVYAWLEKNMKSKKHLLY